MKLTIGRRFKAEVKDFAEASAVYKRVRDESGEGGSTFPFGTLTPGRYRISYNGRIWTHHPYPDSKPVWPPLKTYRISDGELPGAAVFGIISALSCDDAAQEAGRKYFARAGADRVNREEWRNPHGLFRAITNDGKGMEHHEHFYVREVEG